MAHVWNAQIERYVLDRNRGSIIYVNIFLICCDFLETCGLSERRSHVAAEVKYGAENGCGRVVPLALYIV